MTTQLEQAFATLEELSARWPQIMDAVVALRAALADAALERMAENARELGLNYEQPAQNEPVCDQDPYLCWFVRCQLGKVCKNARNQQPAQDEQGDSICQEDDGCPTELAVLQRFWRGQSIPDEHYPAWFKPAQQEPDQRLVNLLCRIHRDGGHYIAEHGLDKAVADADIKVAELNAMSDTRPQAREPLSDSENNGGKTGWPPGLLQDDHSGLSRWLASKPDARQKVRKSLEQPAQQQGSHTFYDGEGNVVVRLDTTGDITMDYTKPSEWAKPAQDEPVAWMHPEDYKTYFTTIPSKDLVSNGYWIPLYTRPQAREPQPCPYVVSTREGTHYCSLSQREWVGLTDEEIKTIVQNEELLSLKHFARALEAKLKEKNT